MTMPTAFTQSDPTHIAGHGFSVIALVASLLGFFPFLAGACAAVWYTIQIYESDTCQKWINARRMKRKTRKIAKLKAEQKVLAAELEALEVVREARVIADDKIAKASHEAAAELAREQAADKLKSIPGK